MKAWQIAMAVGFSVGSGWSQQSSVGTVAAVDAMVSGPGGYAVKVADGRAELAGSSSVTAKPGHNAEVALARGGSVTVCQTSVLHTTASADASLLLALDRGAMEIRMNANAGDVVMTPDLRIALAAGGPLELQLRVSRNGDTCVDNRGRRAPLLNLTDSFGEASYQIRPGQHVLFEHGNLREVVDRETTPCGCPPAEQPGVSIAEALLSGGRSTGSAKPREDEHPFPAAASAGMADPGPLPPETPGVAHVQVGATLTYDPSAPKTEAPETTTTTVAVSAVPPPTPGAASGPKHGMFSAIGGFFKRIFVR